MTKINDKILLIEKLRDYLRAKKYSACIIPQNDSHLSEYVPDYYKIREFFSGFNGSAGVLVVGLDFAILWTDGRYFIQAEKQLSGTGIELYKQGVDGVPSVLEFLSSRFTSDDVIIANANCISAEKWKLFSEKLNIKDDSEWEKIWSDRPEIKKSKIWKLDWADKELSYIEKVRRIREKMISMSVQWCLISALDEFSWLFNWRANDIEYTPVVRGYAILGINDIYLFIDSENIVSIDAKIYNYEEIDVVISSLNGKIWIDESKTNAHLYNVCASVMEIFSKESPIVDLKAIKSESEIQGFRKANVYDAIVWIRLMIFLEKSLSDGIEITELDINDRIIDLKSKNIDFISESFESIVAYGENAAIVHYSATENSNTKVLRNGFLLIDSGTHYNIGTTDITRTLVCGELTYNQQKRFTQVLKGMIAVADAKFSMGTTGADLDEKARQFLKSENLDYLHGTGHGIGSVLCVHEDGVGISRKYIKPILSGMVCSDEPGYYEEGEFGIRIENMLLCSEFSENQLGFEVLTLVPIDLEAIDVNLLTVDEIKWINNYHKNIKIVLREYLNDDEYLWLDKKYYEI